MAKTQTECIQVKAAENRDMKLSNDANGRFPNQAYFIHQDKTKSDLIVITTSVFTGISNNQELTVDPTTKETIILTVDQNAKGPGAWTTKPPKRSKKKFIAAAGGIIIEN